MKQSRLLRAFISTQATRPSTPAWTLSALRAASAAPNRFSTFKTYNTHTWTYTYKNAPKTYDMRLQGTVVHKKVPCASE
jgi:hypothetical protein